MVIKQANGDLDSANGGPRKYSMALSKKANMTELTNL